MSLTFDVDAFIVGLRIHFVGDATVCVVPDSRFREDLGFDSLQLLELWVALEMLVERPVDPGLIEGLSTVRDAYEFLEAHSAVAEFRAGRSHK